MNCRICKKEIKEGTLCKKCLFTLSDEILTLEERQQRNSIKTCSIYFKIGGVVMLIIGIFIFLLGALSDEGDLILTGSVMAVIGAVATYIVSKFGYKEITSFCPACQRKDCLEFVKKDLIGEQRTTITETREIKQTYKNGSTSRQYLPETYEMQVDVPAMRRTYRITYKCNKCGYVGTKTETQTDKI